MMTRRSLRIAPRGTPAWPGRSSSRRSSRAAACPADQLPKTLNAFLFFFMIYTRARFQRTSRPTAWSARRSSAASSRCSPTPASDGEILLGKALAALVPPLVVMWAGMVTLMALCDAFTHATLGYLYFPNWLAAVTRVRPRAAPGDHGPSRSAC